MNQLFRGPGGLFAKKPPGVPLITNIERFAEINEAQL